MNFIVVQSDSVIILVLSCWTEWITSRSWSVKDKILWVQCYKLVHQDMECSICQEPNDSSSLYFDKNCEALICQVHFNRLSCTSDRYKLPCGCMEETKSVVFFLSKLSKMPKWIFDILDFCTSCKNQSSFKESIKRK